MDLTPNEISGNPLVRTSRALFSDGTAVPVNISANGLAQWIVEGKVSEERAASFLLDAIDDDPALVSEVLYALARTEERNGTFRLGESEGEGSKALRLLELLPPEQRAAAVGYVTEHYGAVNNCRYDRLNRERDFISRVNGIISDLRFDQQGNILNSKEFREKRGVNTRKAIEMASYDCYVFIKPWEFMECRAENISQIYAMIASRPETSLALLLSYDPSHRATTAKPVAAPVADAEISEAPRTAKTEAASYETTFNGIYFTFSPEAEKGGVDDEILFEMAEIVKAMNKFMPDRSDRITTVNIFGGPDSIGGYYDGNRASTRDQINIRYGALLKANYTSTVRHEIGHAIYRAYEESYYASEGRTAVGVIDKCYSALRVISGQKSMPAFELFDDSNYNGESDIVGHPEDSASELFASASNIFMNYGDELAYNIEHSEDPAVRTIGILIWCALRSTYGGVFTRGGEDAFAQYTPDENMLNVVDDIIASAPPQKKASHPRR